MVKRLTGKFIAPIPFEWFDVSNLDAHEKELALCIWHSFKLQKKNPFVFSYKKAKEFHISEWKVKRVLKKLEEKKMIIVERSSGKSPVITLIIPNDDSNKKIEP